jgi:polysaccharide pyruvyl transferase WcaK-like protein
MTKILFIGGNLSQNKGGAAIVLSARSALKKIIPDAEFTLTTFIPKYDLKMGSIYNIRVVPESDKNEFPFQRSLLWQLRLLRSIVWKAIDKLFGLNAHKLIDEKILKEYANSDIIIEISGDGLSGDYGASLMTISLPRILICTLLEKTIVIYAQSIGPFKIKWPLLNRQSLFLSYFCGYFARFVLNKVDLITVREEITLNILKNFGITKPPIYLTADSAFLLLPTSKEKVYEILSSYGVDHEEQIIGLSVSRSISMLQYNSKSRTDFSHYKDVIIQIIDYLTDKLDTRIILIPHVTGPGIMNDDRIIGAEIYQCLKNKKKVVLISEDLTPAELKGIIGRCNLFIGSRMHANIASISMKVPTVAIGYSHKTEGIMKAAGQEAFICDFGKLTSTDIIAKIEKAWVNRERIAKELEQNIQILEEKANYNAILVKELLHSGDSELLTLTP